MSKNMMEEWVNKVRERQLIKAEMHCLRLRNETINSIVSQSDLTFLQAEWLADVIIQGRVSNVNFKPIKVTREGELIEQSISNYDFKRPLTCELKPKQEARTLQQNRLQWGGVYEQIEQQLKKDKFARETCIIETTKQIVEMFSDADLKKMLHEMFKILFSRKTTTLNHKHNDGFNDSFEEYIHDVIHHMMKFGVHVELPKDTWEVINSD